MIIATVIIPAYNEEKTIRDCLSSIMAQDFPKDCMQTVVADNGSVDSTPKIIANLFPEVEMIKVIERGSGYARNAAILLARGQYILSTDADCVADRSWVSNMVHAFEESPGSVACLGGQILPYRVKTVVERYRKVWIQQQNLREGKAGFLYAETPNAAFRREVFDKVGFFDKGHDDSDMGLRLTRAGLGIRYVPNAIILHRNPTSLIELYNQRLKYGQRMVLLSKKYPDIFGSFSKVVDFKRLVIQTIRRIAVDVFFKFPYSLLMGGGDNGTRLWPLLDAVVAIGNYAGVYRAIHSHKND